MITDRLIRPASMIPHRAVRIHEAGHFVVGTALNFPMRFPRVFADGSGLAPINREVLPPESLNPPERSIKDVVEALPKSVRADGVVHVVALYLAGYAAEVLACDEHPDRRHVYGAGAPDLRNALELLAMADMLHDRWLLAGWNLALNTLRRHWDSVIDVAAAIQVSEPTESDRRALAA